MPEHAGEAAVAFFREQPLIQAIEADPTLEIGLACLDPQRAGGRPRLLGSDDEWFVIQTVITRPAKLGQPFPRWSLR